MKKLFALRNRATGELGDQFFSDKQRAKAYRDELNGGKPDNPETNVKWVVTYGPEHRKHQAE
jgi:hypothetical protein